MTPEQITERIDELLEFWEQYSTGSQEQHSEEEYKEAAVEWLPILTSMKDGVMQLQSRIDELDEQLRNSIPKPVVEVVNDDDGTSRVEVNGTMIIICPTALANTRAYYLRDALGLVGGGDE